jgi:hypothetical protein
MMPPAKSQNFQRFCIPPKSFLSQDWRQTDGQPGPSSAAPVYRVGKATLRSPPHLLPVSSAAPANLMAQSITRPPGLPAVWLPCHRPILTTRDRGEGPVRFYTVLLAVEVKQSGVLYLVSDNEHGSLWHGHHDGDMSYFDCPDRPRHKFPLAGFKLGNKLMKAISAEFLFPLYDSTKTVIYRGRKEGTRVKWQNVFLTANAVEEDYTCHMRLANEVAICERLRLNPSPYLAEYLGVKVADLAGGQRVKSVVFSSYNGTLWQFASELHLLREEHIAIIERGIEKALNHLHRKHIVHKQVLANNVYLNWQLMLQSVPVSVEQSTKGKWKQREEDYRDKMVAHIQAVVLGNFEQAKDFLVDGGFEAYVDGVQHDQLQLDLLGQWLRIPLGTLPSPMIDASKRLQSGMLEGKEQKDMEGRLKIFLPPKFDLQLIMGQKSRSRP